MNAPSRPGRRHFLLLLGAAGFGLSFVASMTFYLPSTFERRHVDDKTVAHVALDHPFVSFVHFLNRNLFDVGCNVMLSAEIEHLLGFFDASDHGTREAAAFYDQWKRAQRNLFLRNAYDHHRAVESQ